MKKRRTRRKRAANTPGPPSVRLPLPSQTEKRHGAGKRCDRKKEKARLRKLLVDD
jgi:hypothetical protein